MYIASYTMLSEHIHIQINRTASVNSKLLERRRGERERETGKGTVIEIG